MKKLFVFWIIALVFVGCNNSPTESNPDPIVVRKGIVGTVLDKSGHKIKGAKVKVISSFALKKSSADSVSTDSTITNDKGEFQIVVDAGTYDVQSNVNDGSLVSLTRNVGVTDTAPTVLIDTVKVPGKISGTVSLSGGALGKRTNKMDVDLSKVSCFIPRVSPVYRADKDGTCEIPIVPEGDHNVIFEYPEYVSSIESLHVESGKTVSTTVSLSADPSYRPPTPVLKELIYDTLAGTVTIVWTRVLVSDLRGYTIFRSKGFESNPSPYFNVEKKDTIFIDTLFKNSVDTLPIDLLYYVKSLDTGMNVSENYSNKIRLIANPPYMYKTKIKFTTPSKVSIGDSVWVIASFTNALRKTDSVFWEYDGDTVARPLVGNVDSIRVASDSVKKILIKCRAKDNFGYVWNADTSFNVQLFSPSVKIKDTAIVDISKPYVFTASGTDTVGSIVSYEWDINGDGKNDTVTTSNTFSVYLDKSGSLIVTVKDDDGNVSKDTTTYRVFNMWSGHITKDTVVEKSSVPYMVNIIIDSGVTFTAGPGVVLELNGSGGGWGIRVDGNLILAGVEGDSVRLNDFNGNSGVTFGKKSVSTKSTFDYVCMKIKNYGINIIQGKNFLATHTHFDHTHIVAGDKQTAMNLIDPKSMNAFDGMNIQFPGGVLEN